MRLLLLTAAWLGGSGGLTVGVSDTHPGVRPVALKVKFGSQLQCGQAIGPPLAVTFPAAERVPRTISSHGFAFPWFCGAVSFVVLMIYCVLFRLS